MEPDLLPLLKFLARNILIWLYFGFEVKGYNLFSGTEKGF